MRGLIPNTLARLERVRAFTPNLHAQWQAEENERVFLEWCRTSEERPLRDDLETYEKQPWWRKLTALIP